MVEKIQDSLVIQYLKEGRGFQEAIRIARTPEDIVAVVSKSLDSFGTRGMSRVSQRAMPIREMEPGDRQMLVDSIARVFSDLTVLNNSHFINVAASALVDVVASRE